MDENTLFNIVEALHKAIHISKYITKKDEKYRKDKKTVKKMLKNIKQGELSKYLEGDGNDYDE